MRVYLPSTLPGLAATLRDGQLQAQVAFAVTPALWEAYASGDQEELEYVALTAAARASLRLLGDDLQAPARRVVLAVEVDDAIVVVSPEEYEDPAHVTISGPVPAGKLISAHVDDDQAASDIRAAIQALAAADAGDDDAAFDVDQAEGHELGWYAAQELPHLFN